MSAVFFAMWAALGATAAAPIAPVHAVPATLVASLHDSTSPLTSIVVTDIDRDGDADVVATDEALHLFVWINDGTGRLTRQRPTTPHDGCAAAPPRGVERGTPASEPSAPSDPPSLDAPVTVSHAMPFEWRLVRRATSSLRRNALPATRRLRGPPAGDLLHRCSAAL